MKKLFLSFCVGVLLYAFGIPLTASASGGVFFITYNPEHPGSDQDVKVQIKSTAVQIDSSNIIWYINGEVQKEGIGQTKFSFRTGPAGTSTIIDIVIMAPDGKKYTEHEVLNPLDVDFLWEANTYVPPFYKGKARPTYQSMIRTTAIPFFGATSTPGTYVYDWTLGRTAGIGKGLGKNTAQIPAAWPHSNVSLKVHAASLDGSQEGERTLNILSVDPVIRFYEKHPLSGVNYSNALRATNLSSGEFHLRAVPFFFGNEDRDDKKLIYTWRLNGKRIGEGSNPEELTITGGNGVNEISLLVEDARRVLQVAEAKTTIINR
jgi:hypothetical protein